MERQFHCRSLPFLVRRVVDMHCEWSASLTVLTFLFWQVASLETQLQQQRERALAAEYAAQVASSEYGVGSNESRW